MPSNPGQVIKKIFSTNRRMLVQKAVTSAKFSKYKKVLVVGAGYDPYRKLFPNAEIYVALDIDCIQGATTVVGDAHKLPFMSDAFDCVFAVEVLEHLENSALFLSEVYRTLDEGGRLFSTVPFMFHTHADPYDYCRHTEYSLKKLLSSFSSVTVYGQGNRLQVIADLFTTTSFKSFKPFIIFRILNHAISNLSAYPSKSTSPSGFVINCYK